MIKDHLQDKSPDYIEGFLFGVMLFAYWKDGVQFVGTCGTTYVEVLKCVNELLNERKEKAV